MVTETKIKTRKNYKAKEKTANIPTGRGRPWYKRIIPVNPNGNYKLVIHSLQRDSLDLNEDNINSN